MTINITREKILHKGFANISDIRKFVPCGYEKAKKIFLEIRSDVENEGKSNFENSILSVRLFPYIGLTEKKVMQFAKTEKADLAESTKD